MMLNCNPYPQDSETMLCEYAVQLLTTGEENNRESKQCLTQKGDEMKIEP
jgi:hypothetical protein